MSDIDVDVIYFFIYNMTQCEFIDKLKKVHGDKYNYSITYIGNKENNYKTTAICNIHGEFSINMYNFLNGQGCGECAKIKRSKSKEITNEVLNEGRRRNRIIYKIKC